MSTPTFDLLTDHLVPFDEDFELSEFPTAPPADTPSTREVKKERKKLVKELRDLQRVLYADGRYAVLAVFQAMDAGGKDSTIRKVFSGVNPAGFRVHAFGPPSTLERQHDFLWRCATRVPERGRIGIFNRSHYEEVLIVRVHPEYLKGQNLPHVNMDTLWDDRLESIRDWERHLARNGVVVVKFWLNVSRAEQKRRLLRRVERPDKNWKFQIDDLDDRERWPEFMHAYEQALRQTSRPHAPWYAIPADDKQYMRREVARVMVHTLRQLELSYPTVSDEQAEAIELGRQRLQSERE